MSGTGTGLINNAKDTFGLISDGGGFLLNKASGGYVYQGAATRTQGRIDGAIALGKAAVSNPVDTALKIGGDLVAPFVKGAGQLNSGDTFGGTETITEASADKFLDLLIGGGKALAKVLAGGVPGVKIKVPNGPRNIDIDLGDAGKGSRNFELLNADIQPNASYRLSNGNSFTTNEAGRVESSTFQPVSSTGTRDGRQTAVGKEGIEGDVGGHIQACSLGGTCDRFNLFPQNGNFNNCGYKKVENEIRGALDRGENVGPVKVEFIRTDPTSARPDRVVVTYTINGVKKTKPFTNKAGN